MPSSRLGCPLSLKTPNMGNTGSYMDLAGLAVAIAVGALSGAVVVLLGWQFLTKQSEKPRRDRIFGQIRPNILILALFVTGICVGILYLLRLSFDAAPMGNSTNYDFVAGALIGLLGAGISGLVAIASNLTENGNGGNGEDKCDKK